MFERVENKQGNVDINWKCNPAIVSNGKRLTNVENISMEFIRSKRLKDVVKNLQISYTEI